VSRSPSGRFGLWGAGKSLARPTSRCRRTESIVSLERGVRSCVDAEVIAAAETRLDGQQSELFLSDLQKLEQRAKKWEIC
jgi:hypothetical protein